jgi:hypothetical protein
VASQEASSPCLCGDVTLKQTYTEETGVTVKLGTSEGVEF